MIALFTISVAMAQTTYSPIYDGTFGNAIYSQTFTFPTGAEAWAHPSMYRPHGCARCHSTRLSRHWPSVSSATPPKEQPFLPWNQ